MAIRGTLFPLHFTMIGSLYIVLVDKIIAENNDCHYLCLESDSDSVSVQSKFVYAKQY